MTNIAGHQKNRLRIAIQGDQLSSPTGGGRFIRGFLRTLFSEFPDQIDRAYVLVTQNESIACLGKLPPNVTLLKQRFPCQLRYTPLARLFGYTLPSIDVAFGPFYHVFPSSRAKIRGITLHDMSYFDARYHPQNMTVRNEKALMTRTVQLCNSVVCISNATLREFQDKWPQLAHKAVMIYNGVSAEETRSSTPRPSPQNSILAVGTIEPRKNYSTLLDAYEQLLGEQGDAAPLLNIVGGMGWLSDDVVRHIMALQTTGKCKWLQNISDAQLVDAYNHAGVFTYLSLCEGFGYPPFEAAFAGCPMVLGNASSVGEIWSQHATCVDPLDVDAIVAAWKWALGLSPSQRETVAAVQKKRAQEFTWKRTVEQYVAHWQHLITGMKR